MELQILHAIQGMHTPWLDPVMVFISALGNAGIFWIALSVILLFFRKTRRCGATMLGGMAISFLLGNVIIKNLVGRARPFILAPDVSLLIPFPGEYSFPSGHTLNGITAATVLFLHFRKPGVIALLFASMIAFSRLYLFVHFPTDILGGILLGVFDAMLACFFASKLARRGQARRQSSPM